VIIHTSSRNEIRNTGGDSKHDGFTTATQVTSSEHTLHKPQPDSGIEPDVTLHKSVISTSSKDDTSASNVASSAEKLYSGTLSSSSSASYSASRSQQYQQNQETSAVISSTVKSHEYSQAISGVEDANITLSNSTEFSSSSSATQDVTSSSATSATQINNNQTSKQRITQRSQTGELIDKTIQSTSGTADIKSPVIDQPSGTVTVTTSNIQTSDGSSSSTKTAGQRTVSEFHKLDSFSSTQNTAVGSRPVNLGDAHDSSNWTVVSSDKNQTVNNATNEFVFCPGHATEDKKDSTTQHNGKFIQHERTTSVLNRHDVREPVDATPRKADEETPTTTKQDKADLQNVSEATEIPKREVSTRDKTAGKDDTNISGHYVTTYQQAYTNKRISVDLSPTHEAFARSLRASPERATPPSSTRSSSKASLDRSSPDRLNKSPTRSYRNKTSLDNTLVSGRTSPDKTPRSKTPPIRTTPDKIPNRVSPRHSSPEKAVVRRSSPSRVSPEKPSNFSERTSPVRSSPEKTSKSPYSPPKDIPEKAGKLSATDKRKRSEAAAGSSENDDSPSVSIPDESTRTSHAETTSSFKTYPEKLQQDKPSDTPEKKISSHDKPHHIINTHSPAIKASDFTKTYSSVSNRDSAVKAKTTKEKRKLSSGLSRATTKKRSSTPGVSPNTSPTRDDETRLTERQSRPRSRGTASHSSTDSEDNDSDTRSKKRQNETGTGDDISKTVVQITLSDNESDIKWTELKKSNTESYTAGGKIATALPSEIVSETSEQVPKGKKTSADYSPRKDNEPRKNVPEDSGLEIVKTKSSVLSTTDRAPDKISSVTNVPRKLSSEDKINVNKMKRRDSATVTAKKNKSSERECYETTERIPSAQKTTPDDLGTKSLPHNQESRDSSPSSSPNAVSPTIHTRSPKSVFDRLPRDKSPEYSSEGSLVNELYSKRSTTDVSREEISFVNHPADIRKDSPDSSPDRGNFKPIKCFRTSPEIRPSTLEFAHPEKQAPFKASPEKTKSPTKSFKSETLYNATANLESDTEGAVTTLTEPSTVREPISFTNTDFKKSPERPNTSPAFDNAVLSATSMKIDSNTFNSVQVAPKDMSPDSARGNIYESECKPDQNTEYPSTKRASHDQTRIYQQDLGTTTTNGTSEKVPSEYRFEKPCKLSEKQEDETSEDRYDEIKQFRHTARESRTQNREVDKVLVQESNEPKYSSVSPRSSSPEKSPATRTAKITVQLTSPHKRYLPQDRKAKSTWNSPSSSTAPQSSSQQYPSGCSPEGESVKRRTIPTSSHPQKSKDTESSKQTGISNRISDTSLTPDKSVRKRSDISQPLPSKSPENPKFVSQPTRENPASKVFESKRGNQIPSRDQGTVQTPKRPSRKASLSPDTSPDRTSLNRTPHKKYDSSSEFRQSPTPSTRRLNDREINSDKFAKSPNRSPSSSPERHICPEKKTPSVKPSTKLVSVLPENYTPSSSPEKPSRIPSSGILDRPRQSPAKSSETSTKCNQNISRSRHSPVRPVQKTRPNYSPARINQSPVRQSEQNTRINHHNARVGQSPAHSSASPGHKYGTVKPKKSGSDTVPTKSAFVRTSSKSGEGSHLPRTLKEPGHTSDRYPRQSSPSKQRTILSPSKKDFPATKEPKQDKPSEIEDEGSTDRSSTVSSPETVKTAGDNTAVNGTEFVNTKATGQKLTAALYKRTEMYIPQLTCDKDTFPSEDDQGDKAVSLSTLRSTAEIKAEKIPASVTISVTSDGKAKEDILEDRHHKVYYSQDYSVDDLRDETPPDEFLAEEHSPAESPFQPYSAPRKPQQTGIPSKSKMAEITYTSNYDRTTTLATKISNKSTRNESRKQKQEPPASEEEKRNTPSIQSKQRPRIATTVDIRITRSYSDKNVTRKQASPGSVQPRRQTSKPEMTVSRTTVARNASSSRQQQITAVGTATTARTTKIPTQSVKPTLKKIPYPIEQKRSKDTPKPVSTSAARNRTFVKKEKVEVRNIKQTKNKLANGLSDKPHTSSSEDEVPETITDDEKEPTLLGMDDEYDDTYVRELDEIRRTDEEQYASKLTPVRTLKVELLSPSQDVSGIIIEPLKSSRDSSPEYSRATIENASKPRYADRISEPEDDDDVPRHYTQKPVFQKSTFLPEVVDEECTNDDNKRKTEELVENSQPKESTDYVIHRAEQVTDLDEESETEQAPKSVSVADRVSHFLETTRNILNSIVPTQPEKPSESSPKPLDSPSTVRRARAMFENIAHSQTSTHKDFTKLKDTTNVFEAYHDSRKESTLPGTKKPENQRRPAEEQLPERHDILNRTPGTKYSVKRSLFNEYPVDTDEDNTHYEESYPVRIKENAEKPRTPSTDAHIHRKSPSPERLGSRESAHTQPRNKSPVSAYPDSKKSGAPEYPDNRNYNTYAKVKPLKDSTPGIKPAVTQPGTSPNTYGIFTGQHLEFSDVSLIDKSPHYDQQVKEFSQEDKQEGSFYSRAESKPKQVEQQDTHPRKQSVREDFPEDTVIQTFTKDTATLREASRQKDILNRPSVFEARRLGQKLAPSKQKEEFKHSYEDKTSGYAEIQPSKDAILARDDVEYTKDTLTKKTETGTYATLEHPQSIYTHCNVTSVRKDSTSIDQFSTDTYSERISSKDYSSHSTKDLAPRKGYPIKQESEPSSGRDFPKRNDSYPKREKNLSQVSTFPKKEQPEYVIPSSKATSPGHYITPRDSSPTRNISRTKDKSAHLNDVQPTVTSNGKFSVRKNSPVKDTSPTSKVSYPRGESPARNYSAPKDPMPTGNDAYSKDQSPRESSPTRKHSSQKSTSPKRKESYPKGESPREDSPTRQSSTPKDILPATKDTYSKGNYPRDSSPGKYSASKDTLPKRKQSYPEVEAPRDSSPTRKHPSPKDTSSARDNSYPNVESPTVSSVSSPTRKHPSPMDTSSKIKDSYPEVETPRYRTPPPKHQSPKDTSPKRRDSYPDVESPRDESPPRRHPSPKDTSSTRKDSYPKEESSRDSSPARKHTSPKDTSPKRKDSYPKVESSRESSPTRKHTSPKDTSPTRKDSYPKVESPRDSSPTRKHTSPKDTSPIRKDLYSKVESPRDSSPIRKHTSPKDTSPTRKDSYPKVESPRDSSPIRKHTSPKDTSPTRKDSYSKVESPRDSSPTRKHTSPKDTSPTRKDSYSSRVTCNISSSTIKRSSSKDESPRRRASPSGGEPPVEFSPTREYSVPVDTSPAGDENHPSLKGKITDNRSPTDGSAINQEISPKRTSVTRPEIKPGTPKRDSQSTKHAPKQEPKPLETGALPSSGRFGVNLRRTGSTVGSTIQRRPSGESSKPVTTLKKGDELRIEDIFDLELLENMVS
jgi:hypothetical protein